MSLCSFLRDMFLFDWLFGRNRKGAAPTNQTNSNTHNHDCDCGHDEYTPPLRSNRTYGGWDDGHYASNDYYHDSYDDYAHDFDDFDDDF